MEQSFNEDFEFLSSIYQKLEVASRDELMLYFELFRCCGRQEELTGGQAETESC